MGRRLKTVQDRWQDCNRCLRRRNRLGVAALAWPSSAKVVIFSSVAPREAQVHGGNGGGLSTPAAMQLAARLKVHLGLSDNEVVLDHLVACGLGGSPRATEAAACIERAEENLRVARGVAAMVLVDEPTQRLASASGFHDGGTFTSTDGSTSAPVITGDETTIVGAVARALSLPQPKHATPPRPDLRAKTATLRRVLGPHGGKGTKRAGGTWQRDKGAAITDADLNRHRAGETVVAPLYPRAWPYVVLDLDRHHPLQELHFDDTLAWVRKSFPSSILVQSSNSAGAHAYLPLPDKTKYSEAAWWLRAHVTLSGAAYRDLIANENVIRAEVIEVPTQPPRLPFGEGSFLLDQSHRPLDQQVDIFARLIASTPPTDYLNAVAEVRKDYPAQEVTRATRRKIAAAVARVELGATKLRKVDKADPWYPLSKHLSQEMNHVVAIGSPALGTRTRWTNELVRLLPDYVDEDEAVELMTLWLSRSGHQSADLRSDPDRVLRDTENLVRERYDNAAGVPERAWSIIEAAVTKNRERLRMVPTMLHPSKPIRNPKELRHNDAIATAFFLAKRFYELGHRERPISSEEFGQFCGKNMAADMEMSCPACFSRARPRRLSR